MRRKMLVIWIYFDSTVRHHYKSESYGQTSLLGLNLILTCIVLLKNGLTNSLKIPVTGSLQTLLDGDANNQRVTEENSDKGKGWDHGQRRERGKEREREI